VKKFLILALAFALLAVALPATAQDGTVSMLIRMKPKAGMTDQWEEGVKKHMEFHGQQGDTWSWAMWEVISGDKTGEFTVGTYGHEWSDFDNMPVSGPEDEADGKKNTEAYTESVSIMYSNYMPEFSLPPDGSGQSKLLSTFGISGSQSHDGLSQRHRRAPSTRLLLAPSASELVPPSLSSRIRHPYL